MGGVYVKEGERRREFPSLLGFEYPQLTWRLNSTATLTARFLASTLDDCPPLKLNGLPLLLNNQRIAPDLCAF